MFNLTLAEVITVLGMCAATYSSRLLGYLFLRKKNYRRRRENFWMRRRGVSWCRWWPPPL